MPRALRGTLLLALLAGCGGDGAPRAEAAFGGRSVLVLVVDSLEATHLGCYGARRGTSPAIDALAARGVRFESAYSQSSWTLPSVASLFTSLEQERHGLRRLEESLDPELETLAERFSSAGWRTFAAVQTPVLGSATGLDQGFERYRVLDFSSASAERAVELTLGAFASEAEGPLFAYLHLAPPHMPYQPPAPFRGRFEEPGGNPAVDGSIASCRRIHKARLAPDHPDVLRLQRLYDEHVAYADSLVGRVVRGLADQPSPPLVVFTSDHGEAFMEHGSQGHNATVYEEMLRVPLVFADLGRRPGLPVAVRPGPASLLDLAPTLAELCGLEPFEGGGRSLVPALYGRGPLAPRPLYFSSRYKERFEQLELALRESDHKLVWVGADGRTALYDLTTDPGERVDLAGSEPELAGRLADRLRNWYEARSGPGRAASARTEAELRALGELGYADR